MLLKDGVLGANTVDSAAYVDGSIDTAHIANDQITAALIADNAIDYYYYYIENVLAQNNKTIYQIHIEPDNRANPGFSGKIFISDSTTESSIFYCFVCVESSSTIFIFCGATI